MWNKKLGFFSTSFRLKLKYLSKSKLNRLKFKIKFASHTKSAMRAPVATVHCSRISKAVPAAGSKCSLYLRWAHSCRSDFPWRSTSQYALLS